MIEPDYHGLSIQRQCELLGKSRSWYYYCKEIDVDRLIEENRDKRMILEVYNDIPQYGYRKISLEAEERGYKISGKRTYRLMREMGVQAIYPKPRLSIPSKEHRKYPYLLRGLEIKQPDQVWSTDISYIKLPGGNVYLVAILDIYSRKILSWNISNTIDVNFCIYALKKAMLQYGKPEIFNSDQGSQFTSDLFIQTLESKLVRISMDGKGRVFDNIFIERFWRTVKYENIYLYNYETIRELREGLIKYIDFYNTRRFHQSLDYNRPDEIYFGKVTFKKKLKIVS